MFCNVYIDVVGESQLITDYFVYDNIKHRLMYRQPFQNERPFCILSDVDCDIKIDRSLIFIKVKRFVEVNNVD